jgi:hypothetical protein
VCKWAVGHPQASDTVSRGKEPPVYLNRRLGGHQNRSGLFGEAITVLLLPNVKARFLCYPVRSVVTVSPEIFWLCVHLFEFVDVGFSPGNRSHCVYEAHMYPPVDVYGVCGFCSKYDSALLLHLEWQTRGLRPFALRSCHVSAKHTAYIPQHPSH